MSNTTIQFKPEFELRLKRLRIKTKFVNELKKHVTRTLLENEKKDQILLHGEIINVKTHRNIDSAMILNRKHDWQMFILNSFAFWKTKDGADYWMSIATTQRPPIRTRG